jgi:hypothetical protein
MLRSYIAQSVLICLFVTGTAPVVLARSRTPSVFASVAVTATVVNPLGILSGDELPNQVDQSQLMVLYPTADGIQITIHQDGQLAEIIRLSPDEVSSTPDNYSFIQPSFESLRQGENYDPAPQSVVITILSISQ